MIKIFLIGWIILIVAILLNGMISKLGIMGWYDFLNLLVEKGMVIFETMRWKDYLWLFVIYPFLLGLSYKIGEMVMR
jgi:hypothetical protein